MVDDLSLNINVEYSILGSDSLIYSNEELRKVSKFSFHPRFGKLIFFFNNLVLKSRFSVSEFKTSTYCSKV